MFSASLDLGKLSGAWRFVAKPAEAAFSGAFGEGSLRSPMGGSLVQRENFGLGYFYGARLNMPGSQQHNQLYERLLNAVTLQRAGQTAEAFRLYRAVLCEDPGNVDALHLLGVIFWRNKGRLAEALVLMSRALDVASNSPLILHSVNELIDEAKKVGVANHNGGLEKEAEHIYKAILRRQPDNIDVLGVLARLYDGWGSDGQEKRIETYRRLTIHQPNRRENWINFGYSLELAHRYDEAKAAYATGVGHPVDSYGYYTATANILFNAKFGINVARQQFPHVKLERIIDFLQRALQINPYSSEARLILARAYRIRHQVNQALADIDEVLSLNPASFEANTLRGHMLYRKGRLNDALHHYEIAMNATQETIKSLQIVQRDLTSMEKIKRILYNACLPMIEVGSAQLFLFILVIMIILYMRWRPHVSLTLKKG